MIRRIIKWLKRADDAFIIARASGQNRTASLKIALSQNTRDAYLKFGGIPICSRGVIIDVGANRGQFLNLALERFAPRQIVCIEPLPQAFSDLRTLFGNDKRITFFNCAAGAHTGESELEINIHDQASSLLPIGAGGELRFSHRDLTPIQKIKVPIRTLDEISEELGLGDIDLLKIDVQGYELNVLKGAEQFLKRIGVLWIEVNFYPQYEGSSDFWQVHRFLQEKGFSLLRLGDFQKSKKQIILQGDAVYIQKNILT